MSEPNEIQHAHEIALVEDATGVALCDEAGRILFANPRLAAIFGYSTDEIVGALLENLLPFSLYSRDLNARELATRAGRELFGRRKDGTQVPVEIGVGLGTQDGRRLVIVSVVDITERRDQLQELQRSVSERLEFEQLISRLAARFVNLHLDQVDAAIVDSQREIVEALDIDRGAMWQFTDGDEDLLYTHIWHRPEFEPPPARISAREAFPWTLERVRANEATWISDPDEIPHPVDRNTLRTMGTKSAAILPLMQGGRVFGAISFGALRTRHEWDGGIRKRLRLVAAIFAQALARKHNEERLHRALAEVERLRDQLALENVQLKNEVKSLKAPTAIAAESPAVRRVLAQIEQVSATPSTVLLLGETGCGKEVFAQAIHDYSDRRSRTMVRVNCAAIPSQLIESELFGRERGAYTGALSRQIGRFEMADRSTLFLDEIGDLPLEAQVKLLRVLQDKVIERLGSSRPIQVDVRIIAATNRDLAQAVADRSFREDLFYRLNVFPITVPPLRDRFEDIPVLVWTFIAEFSKSFNKRIESISKEDLAALQSYRWPGNVRELRNVIERAVIVADDPHLKITSPAPLTPLKRESVSLSQLEIEHIRAVLDKARWRVRGPGGAAELLGMKPTTLDSRMAKLGIRRPVQIK